MPMRQAAVRKAGFVSAVAMPITFGPQVIGVLELFSDEPHTPDQTLVNLMVDINAQIGKIVERERMTAEMADLTWREQQGLLHTLHDTLGQTLTAVNVLSCGARPPAPGGGRRGGGHRRSDRAAGEAGARTRCGSCRAGCFRSTSMRSTS